MPNETPTPDMDYPEDFQSAIQRLFTLFGIALEPGWYPDQAQVVFGLGMILENAHELFDDKSKLIEKRDALREKLDASTRKLTIQDNEMEQLLKDRDAALVAAKEAKEMRDKLHISRRETQVERDTLRAEVERLKSERNEWECFRAELATLRDAFQMADTSAQDVTFGGLGTVIRERPLEPVTKEEISELIDRASIRESQAQPVIDRAAERDAAIEAAAKALQHAIEKCSHCDGTQQDNDGEGMLNAPCPKCREYGEALTLLLPYADKLTNPQPKGGDEVCATIPRKAIHSTVDEAISAQSAEETR